MTYDPFGRRIQKTVSGTSVDFLYDPAGRPAVVMYTGGNYVRGEVFLGGMHLATYGASGNPYFAYADWMGTGRCSCALPSWMGFAIQDFTTASPKSSVNLSP